MDGGREGGRNASSSSTAILISPGIGIWRVGGGEPRQGPPAVAAQLHQVSLWHGFGR